MSTRRYKGYEILINRMEDYGVEDDPRPYDRIGKIVTLSRNYAIGDFPCSCPADLSDYWAAIYDKHQRQSIVRRGRRLVKSELAELFVKLPIYVMDHSGLTFSLTPFHCPWDSWQIGEIYADLTKVRLNGQPAKREIVAKRLRREFELWKPYIEGDLFEYAIYKGGDYITGCSGYSGSQAEARMFRDARREIDKMRQAAT